MKSLIIFSLLILSSHSRPQSSYHQEYDYEEIDDEFIPAPNDTEKFIVHPHASADYENGDLFQGDMQLTPEQEEIFMEKYVDESFQQTGIGNMFQRYRWPKHTNGKVYVPFVIDATAGFSFDEKISIRLAMKYLEYHTCVKFVKHKNQTDHIRIISGRGCYSWIGRIGGRQDVSLKKRGCFLRGTIMHELIHALGYTHMHNHENRDEYIEIAWENIIENRKFNFKRVDPKVFSNFGTDYDFLSVMHYHPRAFSKNGKATMIPKNFKYEGRIGQRRFLTAGDVERINNMYNCG